MRITSIIFDLDGVICSTDKYHYKAWKQLSDRLGIYFDEKINDRLRGVSRMDSLEIILEKSPIRYSQAEKEAFTEEKNAAYRKLLELMSPEDVLDEIRNVLKALRENGYALAIGSSSKNTKLILNRIGLEEYFDAVADGTDIVRSKPDPEVFLCAAKKLGSKPDECAVVEDAKTGITAAKRAGMLAFAFGGDAAGCGIEDYDLDSFADIFKGLDLFSTTEQRILRPEQATHR